MRTNRGGKSVLFLFVSITWIAEKALLELVLLVRWLYADGNINHRQIKMDPVSEGYTLYQRPPSGRYYVQYSIKGQGQQRLSLGTSDPIEAERRAQAKWVNAAKAHFVPMTSIEAFRSEGRFSGLKFD